MKSKYSLGIIFLFLLLLVKNVAGYYWYSNSTNFDDGTYYDIVLNESGYIELNNTNNGTYLSDIFDTGYISLFDNLSWTVTPIGELPNSKGTDGNFYPAANMTGNVMLYHLNENAGPIFDSSGDGNNGVNNGASYYCYAICRTRQNYNT